MTTYILKKVKELNDTPSPFSDMKPGDVKQGSYIYEPPRVGHRFILVGIEPNDGLFTSLVQEIVSIAVKTVAARIFDGEPDVKGDLKTIVFKTYNTEYELQWEQEPTPEAIS
jgi:hypothetical protein